MRNYNQYLEVLFQVKKGTEVKAFATICFEGFFFKLQLSNRPNKNGIIMQNKFSITLIENIAKNVAYDEKSCSVYRDRFLIIDGRVCYSSGASLNYPGKRAFAITQIENITFIGTLKKRLLA